MGDILISPKPISRNPQNLDDSNLRTRRAAAGAIFAIGVLFLMLAAICSTALFSGCILFGLVLTVPAALCLGVDFLLLRAVRAIQEPRIKKG
ncbi:MAG TPA: hypothetical protein VGM54_06995 [Chthoniobacter sp.]